MLGMLTAGPRTGYDIRRAIHGSIRHFWSESYGQVYPALHELEQEGLVSVTTEPGASAPARKVYTLTDTGWAALREWLARPVRPQPSRNELLLKLFFSRFVSDELMAATVREFRDQWREDLAAWREIAERVPTNERFSAEERRDRLFTLRYGELIGAATVQWADEVLAALGEEPADEHL